jgi:hypothetical protein
MAASKQLIIYDVQRNCWESKPLLDPRLTDKEHVFPHAYLHNEFPMELNFTAIPWVGAVCTYVCPSVAACLLVSVFKVSTFFHEVLGFVTHFLSWLNWMALGSLEQVPPITHIWACTRSKISPNLDWKFLQILAKLYTEALGWHSSPIFPMGLDLVRNIEIFNNDEYEIRASIRIPK